MVPFPFLPKLLFGNLEKGGDGGKKRSFPSLQEEIIAQIAAMRVFASWGERREL